MTDLGFALRLIAIAAPFLFAVVAAAGRRQVRAIGFATAMISAVASALLLRMAPPTE